ncbi:hypothetical protein ABZ816_23780 [Actinosynnema sp. NPDC047251]|nr:hypothetical protein [Saccharothrix espanaensis]
MTLDPINPFAVHPFVSAVQPLEPFSHPHDGLYVAVGDSEGQYLNFQKQLGDLSSVVDYGRTVLVNGDTGCGKSALVNRCAAWARTRFGERKIVATVVDATKPLKRFEQLSLDMRMVGMCDRLFDLMRKDRLIRDEFVDEFERNRKEPERVYVNLGDYMHRDHALILLLPTPVELLQEVVRYADFAPPRVLFMLESDVLRDEHVEQIERAVERWTKPVVLTVGRLVEGDVKRFVDQRTGENRDRGRFPRMSDETVAAVGEKVQTVAQLQRTLHSTFEYLMEHAEDYDNDARVTIEHIIEEAERVPKDGWGTS